MTRRASRILLARQDSAGRWTGRCAGDVTLDAESALVREFLGVSRPELTRAGAQQIRSMQQPDGSWIGGAEPGRPGDLTPSVPAYLALRLAGDPPDAYHLAVGAVWIRDAGGLAAAGLVAGAALADQDLTQAGRLDPATSQKRERDASGVRDRQLAPHDFACAGPPGTPPLG